VVRIMEVVLPDKRGTSEHRLVGDHVVVSFN
jgi:hypothetical protein